MWRLGFRSRRRGGRWRPAPRVPASVASTDVRAVRGGTHEVGGGRDVSGRAGLAGAHDVGGRAGG
jgi:hypothetical protein